MRTLLEELSSITGTDNFFCNRAQRLAYAQCPNFYSKRLDPVLPLAVARPGNMEQLKELLKICAREKLQTTIRGGGTTPGAAPSSPDSLIILTTRLDRILDLNAEDRFAIVQPGVTLAALNRAAKKAGLFFPPDPGSSEICTAGGCVAQNSAGPRSLKYGPTNNYVSEIELVGAGRPNLLFAAQNGQPGKLVPGFPMARLLCGSQGTLGVIGRIKLRLAPLPQTRRGMIARFGDVESAALGASRIAANLLPCSLEIADSAVAAILFPAQVCQNAILYAEFDGTEEGVEKQSKFASEILSESGAAKVEILDAADANDFIMARRAILPKLAGTGRPFETETLACLPSRLPAMIEGVKEIARKNSIDCAIFGHAGVARIHAVFFHNGADEALKSAKQESFALELTLNDALKAETDAWIEREAWQKAHEYAMDISEKLCAIFDPDGIFASTPLPGETGDPRGIGVCAGGGKA